MKHPTESDEGSGVGAGSEQMAVEISGSGEGGRAAGTANRAEGKGRTEERVVTRNAGPSDTARFSGLRVGITGGTSGLGLELVREMARRGAAVAFVARTAQRVAEVAREEGAHGIVGD